MGRTFPYIGCILVGFHYCLCFLLKSIMWSFSLSRFNLSRRRVPTKKPSLDKRTESLLAVYSLRFASQLSCKFIN